MQGISDIITKLIMWLITGDSAEETTWKCFAQRVILTIIRLAVLVTVYLLLAGKFDDILIASVYMPFAWLLAGGARW